MGCTWWLLRDTSPYDDHKEKNNRNGNAVLPLREGAGDGALEKDDAAPQVCK